MKKIIPLSIIIAAIVNFPKTALIVSVIFSIPYIIYGCWLVLRNLIFEIYEITKRHEVMKSWSNIEQLESKMICCKNCNSKGIIEYKESRILPYCGRCLAETGSTTTDWYETPEEVVENWNRMNKRG